ncbi:Uncharacterised protein r2_g1872 [Pycnogonum litorale]
MKRTFESGFQKRKKKQQQQLEGQLQNLAKLDIYFTSENTDKQKNQQDSQQQQKSTTSTGIDNTDQTDVEVTGLTHASQITNTAENIAIKPEEKKCNQSNDVGLWDVLTEDDISYWIQKGYSECQNWEGPFEKSKRSFKNQVRYCSKGLFCSKKVNGERYNREWLVYSPTTGRVYCFVCKLLSTSSTVLSSGGFDDWRNPTVMQNHENSEDHRTSLLSYLTRQRGLTLDSQLEKHMKKEQEYWRHVLERVIAVVCTLAERGLAFRGSNEKFGSPHNGNFLGLLELIALFDPVLANHIELYGNRGSGKPSYLSKRICDEIIQLMANKVRKSILDDLRKAGYFSLSVDSAPDLSHVD